MQDLLAIGQEFKKVRVIEAGRSMGGCVRSRCVCPTYCSTQRVLNTFCAHTPLPPPPPHTHFTFLSVSPCPLVPLLIRAVQVNLHRVQQWRIAVNSLRRARRNVLVPPRFRAPSTVSSIPLLHDEGPGPGKGSVDDPQGSEDEDVGPPAYRFEFKLGRSRVGEGVQRAPSDGGKAAACASGGTGVGVGVAAGLGAGVSNGAGAGARAEAWAGVGGNVGGVSAGVNVAQQQHPPVPSNDACLIDGLISNQCVQR
jgi:hypothetical protein